MASTAEEVAELKKLLGKEMSLRKAAEEEVNNLKSQLAQLKMSEVYIDYLYFFSIFSLVLCYFFDI